MIFWILTTNEKQKKKNSKEELENVSEQYYMLIYKYCYKKLNSNESYSSDVTNEVFVLLCEKWDKLQKEHIKAWLYRTADNLFNEFFRKNKKRLKELIYIDDLDDLTINNLIYEQNFENISDDDIDIYRDEIMHGLSESEKELFNMVFTEKIQYNEICGQLDISRESLKKRLYRLKQKITERVYVKING